ncbi:hypothetical protein GOFOIKOB_5227 [Methylobacterium tardum]|uniref:Uncharacterized protein n=1 Tax=Methylobacterium tardum TaxID=374432 RepID=A0AA37WSE2_9HYPH|nr:hypothetical protein [Methylobacterium tardum]URD38133.1 hypothetical protein M6G65_06595 [Methylobacterium tardum]GJE52159.1 hypothetical protein GOFOIKOB_5227 [Methylobacterium tardum]GLS71725.1 hypothetical protein GCM10007890_37380 [Methylobacterium tardum]
MAELRVLPVDLSAAGTSHISNLLAAAATEGRDLGSRIPHMRMLAHSLDRLAQTLSENVRVLSVDLESNHPEISEARVAMAKLDRLVQEVRKLVEMLDALPVKTPES